MSMLRRADPAPPPATGDARLRVVTAGRVGNMEARLATSGFDVVGIAETEAELIVAVANDEPDAIVVEADLCDSLEHVRQLAPDAVLIVVGDHTPAGAIGRIERGVTGTVMAGLLHALVAEGVAGAVVWGLVPALATRPAPAAQHVGTSLAAYKVHAARAAAGRLAKAHGGLAAAAGTLAVSVSTAVVLFTAASHPHAPQNRADAPAVVQVVPSDDTGSPAPSGSASPGATGMPPSRARPAPAPSHLTAAPGGSTDRTPPAHRPPSHQPPPKNPPAPIATRPPGKAKGWDHRPPKRPDHGRHSGWGNQHPSAPHPATSG
jgi:hypothetical protein